LSPETGWPEREEKQRLNRSSAIIFEDTSEASHTVIAVTAARPLIVEGLNF